MGKILSNWMVEENFNKSKNFTKQTIIFVYDDFLGANSMLSALRIGYPLYLATFFLYGCALADFEPYSGQQQNWPTSPGTFVNNTYVLPTYFGYPPRAHNVI